MCDTFAVVGRDGALFAKNSDRTPTEVQLVEWHPPRPAGGRLRTQYLTLDDPGAHGVVISRPAWLWGAEHGVNEHGLAVGNERVWSRRPLDGPPALVGMDLVRLTLERAASADEGLEVLTGLLAAHGQGGSCEEHRDDPYDSSFLVVDAHGGWIVETSGRDWVAAPVEERAAISNRYTLGRTWTRSSADVAAGFDVEGWHDPGVDTRLADHRLAATRACISGPVDPAGAVAVLRHHGTVDWGAPGRGDSPEAPPAELGDDLSGITVCMHLPGFQSTTASMVAALPADGSPPRVWVCPGQPCVGVYLPTVVGSVPAALGDDRIWTALAALRDRVDADRDDLARIRAVLDPLEDELWRRGAALDPTDTSAWSALAADALRGLDTALDALGVLGTTVVARGTRSR